MTSPRGAFITFEGGDGSGKTTQASALADRLRGQGREVVLTREPGGTPLGLEIRRLLLHASSSMSPHAEALLYAADRAEHVATIVRPALERGAVVVQDRYVDSSVAYQGAGRRLGVDEIRSLSAWASGGLVPDVTVLLDLDPARAAARMASADRAADRLESESSAFHERVRANFLRIAEAEPDRVLLLDADASVADLARAIGDRADAVLAP